MCIHIRIAPFGNLRINSYLLIPAAYHVLHRLLMPRHSPYALLSLTIFELCLILLIFMLIAGFYPTLTFVIVVHFSSFALLLLFIIQFSSFVPCKISLAGGHKWTRTTDLTLIRRALYPPELCAHLVISSFSLRPLVEMRRIELLTPCLQSRCSPS